MEQKLGVCGLNCLECPAYIATMNDDNELREKTAKSWSKTFNAHIKAEDINCKGCFNDEILFSHCFECDIRKCGNEKKVENCGLCGDYPCSKIEAFMKFVPDVKAVLDTEQNKDK